MIREFHCGNGIPLNSIMATEFHYFCYRSLDMSHAPWNVAFMQGIEVKFRTSKAAIQYVCYVVSYTISLLASFLCIFSGTYIHVYVGRHT